MSGGVARYDMVFKTVLSFDDKKLTIKDVAIYCTDDESHVCIRFK